MLKCEPVHISSTSDYPRENLDTDVSCVALPTNGAIPQAHELQTGCLLCQGDLCSKGSPVKSQLAPNDWMAKELSFFLNLCRVCV